jgi:hypothetical protein
MGSLAPPTPMLGRYALGWDSTFLGWGFALLGIFYIYSQPLIALYERLRRWVGFITLGTVLGLLGLLFWPMYGLVFRLAAQFNLITPYSPAWFGLQSCFIWMGFLITELYIIGLRLARKGQHPTSLSSRSRWMWFVPFFLFLLFPPFYFENWSRLLPGSVEAILFMLCFGCAGGCLAPTLLSGTQWENRMYRGGWLAVFGGAFFTLGIVILSLPVLLLL